MKGEGEIFDVLNSVDWNFPDATTGAHSVHSLHWFPGNFIPQIPSYLIQILSQSNGLVFDPFCGSGTTGIEAIRLGRNSLQSDANAVSAEISRAKLAAKDREVVIDALLALSRQLVWEPLVHSDSPGLNGEGEASELARWYNEDTLSQLRGLWHYIERISGEARYFVEMIFTDTLFMCASTRGARTRTGGQRRHHWGWVADNVRPQILLPHNATAIFSNRIMSAIDVLRRIESLPGLSFGVFQQDARCLALPHEFVDLIVTSPPYLGMIDYAYANRLHYLWKGWPIEPDAKREIGTRKRRYRKSAISSYLDAMNLAVADINRVLKPGAYCAIVIGSSTIYPDMAGIVVKLFADTLRLVWGPIEREPSRRRISARINLKNLELIAVFRKAA